MKPVECEFETDVLAAVLQSRWPEHVDAEMRAHAATCPACSEVVAVAGAFTGASNGSLEELRANAEIPDAGRIWWQSQMRARREAVNKAGRPITAIQLVAFGCAVGLLGACFGATSTWFQAMLKRAAVSSAGFDAAAFFAAISKLFAEHGAIVIALVAVIFLVPTALYFVLAKD